MISGIHFLIIFFFLLQGVFHLFSTDMALFQKVYICLFFFFNFSMQSVNHWDINISKHK